MQHGKGGKKNTKTFHALLEPWPHSPTIFVGKMRGSQEKNVHLEMLPSGLNYTNETHISDPKIFTSLNNFPFLPDLHGREKLNAWVFFPMRLEPHGICWILMLSSLLTTSFIYVCKGTIYIYICSKYMCVFLVWSVVFTVMHKDTFITYLYIIPGICHRGRCVYYRDFLLVLNCTGNN